MARDWSVVIDCEDPDRLAEFWTAALGYLRTDWAYEPYIVLAPEEDDDLPNLILQRVPEPKQGKNRLHIDVYADDIEAEAARLSELGAKRLSGEPVVEHGVSWIVMADPEGNELCVVGSADEGE